MKATEEQLNAVEKFKSGGSVKINAFAGTGKTTTLKLLSESTRGRGIYLAFNKAIASDASEKFPKNVSCSTLHSLAYRATPKEFRSGDKMTGSLNANAVAEHLGYKDISLGNIKLSARQQGHFAKETLRQFLQGGKPQIEERHLPRVETIGNLSTLKEEHINKLRENALNGARVVWSRMSDPSDPLPLGHDGYLKLWALSRPQLSAEFLLLDEAQDTNPVVLEMLARQRAQVVYVGDRHQQIYEWRGAVNAMELARADHTTYLTTSFRFGNRIAAAASNVLKSLQEDRALTGNPERTSFIGSDACDAILARTNASVISAVLSEMASGRRPHIIGGTSELVRMLRGVQDLKRGKPSNVAEFFGFSDWEEVVEFSEEPAGESLKAFVSLVESHGEDKLINNLNQVADDESRADIVISTAHKAKGREWDTVELTDDFLPSRPDEATGRSRIDPSEIRLFYVALTRARTAIEFSPAVMTQFDIPFGEQYANPKRSSLKRVGPPLGYAADNFTRGQSPRAIEQASKPHTPEKASGLLWWVLLGVALVVFYALAR